MSLTYIHYWHIQCARISPMFRIYFYLLPQWIAVFSPHQNPNAVCKLIYVSGTDAHMRLAVVLLVVHNANQRERLSVFYQLTSTTGDRDYSRSINQFGRTKGGRSDSVRGCILLAITFNTQKCIFWYMQQAKTHTRSLSERERQGPKSENAHILR